MTVAVVLTGNNLQTKLWTDTSNDSVTIIMITIIINPLNTSVTLAFNELISSSNFLTQPPISVHVEQ